MSYDQIPQENQTSSSEDTTGAPNFGGGDEFDPSAIGGEAKKGPSKSVVILGALILVGAVVLWFTYFRGTPSTAQAGTTPNDGGEQIKQFLDSGNINMMKQTLKETEKIVEQFRSYPGRKQIPLASLRTNPFRELPPDDKDASAALPKDSQREEELHKQAIDAVSELHVQSIIRGTKYKACMINNTLYQEGQQVGILKIEQVNNGAVVVSSGKYRFEVKMQK